MDSPTLEQQIADTEAHIANLQRQMQETDEQFRQSLTRYVGDWYGQETERVVVHENPEHALEVGQGGIKALRDEVKNLADSLPRNAYITDLSLSRAYDVDSASKQLAKNLGRILTSHGFLPAPQSRPGDAGWSYDAGYQTGNEAPTYNGDLPWSGEISKVKSKYSALDGQLTSARDKLRDLKHQKAEEDAQRLWDQTEGQDS